jgi:hypothetical protein
MRNLKVHNANLLGAIAALIVAFSIGQGTLQQYIEFPGVANEIGVFLSALCLSVILFFMSFSKTSK